MIFWGKLEEIPLVVSTDGHLTAYSIRLKLKPEIQRNESALLFCWLFGVISLDNLGTGRISYAKLAHFLK